ncbi:hypothetical protein ACEPAF_1733 [Sanghuangporus sanghuang]
MQRVPSSIISRLGILSLEALDPNNSKALPLLLFRQSVSIVTQRFEMVVTRSMAKKDNAKNGCSNTFASSQAHYKAHSTDAVVPRDVARGAVDNRVSTRSKVAKSNSALHHTISGKDKSAQSYPRTNVPSLTTTSRHDSQKPTRTRKLSRSTQATVKKRGLKSKEDSDDSIDKCIASTTSPTVVGSGEDEYKKEDNTRHPSTRGVKRKSDDEENAPKFERGPRVNTRRVRRRLETQPDEKEARNGRVGVIQKNKIHDGRPTEGPRRSPRLAAKSPLSIPQQGRRRSNRSRKAQCPEHPLANERSVSRKRKRDDEQADDVTEAPGPSHHVRRRNLEGSDREGEREGKSPPASGISTESPQETLVNDKSNSPNICGPGSDKESSLLSSLPLDGDPVSERSSPRGPSHGRHMSIESVPSAIWSEGVKNEPRSPSIESLMTPPPYIKEEEEKIVLINQDLDMMIPLASRDAEEDGAGAVLTHLLQLEDEEPGDEQSIEADEDTHDHVVMNRYRSLAPEPDQGLIDAIRSGEISGLTSPPPSMHEAS